MVGFSRSLTISRNREYSWEPLICERRYLFSLAFCVSLLTISALAKSSSWSTSWAPASTLRPDTDDFVPTWFMVGFSRSLTISRNREYSWDPLICERRYFFSFAFFVSTVKTSAADKSSSWFNSWAPASTLRSVEGWKETDFLPTWFMVGFSRLLMISSKSESSSDPTICERRYLLSLAFFDSSLKISAADKSLSWSNSWALWIKEALTSSFLLFAGEKSSGRPSPLSIPYMILGITELRLGRFLIILWRLVDKLSIIGLRGAVPV